MRYGELTEADLDRITSARVRALEADHYHYELCLAECVDLDEARGVQAKLADLARRIRVHQLEPAEEAEPGADEPRAATPAPDAELEVAAREGSPTV